MGQKSLYNGHQTVVLFYPAMIPSKPVRAKVIPWFIRHLSDIRGNFAANLAA